MKSAYLIVLAVGLMNVAAGRVINETYLDRELRMCGPELFTTLSRICSIHGYDPAAIFTPDLIQSISKACCAAVCKVSDVIHTFCRKDRYWYDLVRPHNLDDYYYPSATKKTTTKMPMTLSAVKVQTTTEKLASIWYLTG